VSQFLRQRFPPNWQFTFFSEVHPKRSEKLEDVIAAIRSNNGVCIKGDEVCM
jgi:hypothetical protein